MACILKRDKSQCLNIFFLNMADKQGESKVLCFVCNTPAVKGRIQCPNCDLYSHIGCERKKNVVNKTL